MVNYGKTIYSLRKKNNLTQAELGKKLNVSYQSVSKWENNLSQPDLETIEKLVKIFNITVSDFFEMSKDNKTENNIDIQGNNTTSNDSIKKYNITAIKTNIFIKQPWYLVALLGSIIIILSLFAFLIPLKYSREKIYDMYSDSVFEITANKNDSEKHGTGFFINNKGLAVTTIKNISNSDYTSIRLNNGNKYDVKEIVGIDEDNGIALIQVDIKHSKSVKFSNNAISGQKVYMISFSDSKVDETKNKISDGFIYKVTYSDKSIKSLQITATLQNEYLGGAVFDEMGRVVAIVSEYSNVSGIDFDMLNSCIPSNKITTIEKDIYLPINEYFNTTITLTLKTTDDKLLESKNVRKYYKLNKYEKTGYIINGFYTDLNCENAFDIKTAIQTPTTIYIDMDPIEYTVIFRSNNGLSETTSQKFYYDEQSQLDICSFTAVENKHFNHWIGRGINYYDAQFVKNLTSKDGDVIYFDAQWGDPVYTIIYDLNYPNCSNYSKSYSYDSLFMLDQVSREGYNFLYWEYDGNIYFANQKIGRVSETDFVITFVARWEMKRYTVEYLDFKGNALKTVANNLTYNQTFTLPNYIYNNKEISFMKLNENTYFVGDTITITNNIKFYVNFRNISFKIQYENDKDVIVKDYTWGNVKLLDSNAFTKLGYKYSAYYSTKLNISFNAGSYLNNPSTVPLIPDEVLILQVKNWTPITYTVKIDNLSIGDTIIDCLYDQEYTMPDTNDYYYNEQKEIEDYSIYIGDEFYGKIKIGETFKNLVSVETSAKIVFKPNWKDVVTTLNFYVGEELYTTLSANYSVSIKIPEYTEQTDGLLFNGWMGNNVILFPNDYVKNNFSKYVSNFYAYFSKELDGSGAIDDPYQIKTNEDFKSLKYATYNSSYSYRYYKLMNDLDFEYQEFECIQYTKYCIFDGNNKTIKNIKLVSNIENDVVSLFNIIERSTIKNLKIENYLLEYDGEECRYYVPFAREVSVVNIENVNMTGSMNILCRNGEDEKDSWAHISGMFVNIIYKCLIKNCCVENKIYFEYENPNNNCHIIVDGFADYLGSPCQITNCYTKNVVDLQVGNSNVYISGFAQYATNNEISNCYSILSCNNKILNLFTELAQNHNTSNCFYGYSTTYLDFLSDVTLLNSLTYGAINSEGAIVQENLENLCSLEYLTTNYSFDETIWKQDENGLIALISTGENDESNSQ